MKHAFKFCSAHDFRGTKHPFSFTLVHTLKPVQNGFCSASMSFFLSLSFDTESAATTRSILLSYEYTVKLRELRVGPSTPPLKRGQPHPTSVPTSSVGEPRPRCRMGAEILGSVCLVTFVCLVPGSKYPETFLLF